MPSDAATLTASLKAKASELGFALAAACPAVAPTGVTRLRDWLEQGFAGEMQYIGDREQAYSHPRYVLDGVRSILMLTLNYRTQQPVPPQPGQGRISRYAWGPTDYHNLIHDRLWELVALVKGTVPGAAARGVVDSAPLLEREFAELAGLGWIGKHTLLLNRQQGSYFFLAALLTDQELIFDQPQETDHCGTCTACLDACPTQAFPRPYLLDATRCISYLTIELEGAIPRDLRSGIGEWLFGCDICQDVCPWNRFAPEAADAEFQPRQDVPANPQSLAALFDLDDDTFRRQFRHTPLWRAKRRGILRNAAIVLGNQQATNALPALLRGLQDTEPVVRGASAWALGKLGSIDAIAALRARQELETDPTVKEEILLALTSTSNRNLP